MWGLRLARVADSVSGWLRLEAFTGSSTECSSFSLVPRLVSSLVPGKNTRRISAHQNQCLKSNSIVDIDCGRETGKAVFFLVFFFWLV